ncbi:MAG TPA: YhbY family RNA-binding protein [Burkholderiales bacterium]|nr:YhbY family RNA-binding protein [Burkholderiales bacterium]
MPLQLSPAERQALKARAHRLQPTVVVGNDGLSASVSAEIDRSLTAHELVKVRVMGEDRDARDAVLGRICDDLGAAPVQHIGKILIVYRPRPQEPRKASATTNPPDRAKRKPPRPLKRSFQNRA